jgi:hypothetical protein
MSASAQLPADDLVLTTGASIDDREERLANGADELAGKRTSVVGGPNILLIAAGVLVTLGLTAILLAWAGASRSTIIEEQVPYLISGGLLGVALAVVGAMTYFAHWLTVFVREARDHETARAQDHDELMEALRALRDAPRPREEGNGTAGSGPRKRPVRRTQSRS